MVRTRLAVLAALMLLAGCGGGDGAPRAAHGTPSPEASAAAKAKGPIGTDAPVLVEMTMRRPGALLDKITIHTDGYGLFDRPSGGVGRVQRDVVVVRAVLRRLRASVEECQRGVRGPAGAPEAKLA